MNIDQLWYGKKTFLNYLLLPFSWLYYLIISFRQFLFKKGVKKITTLPVPVIVVGNITVGGTGKTPLVIWLVNQLKARGYKPGVISRGYKGQAKTWPQRVMPDTDPKKVGDEPVLIAKKTRVPVYVSPHRVQAGQRLLAENDCDVIVSDDGLQHTALARQFEIVVLDAKRQVGNGFLLPAGPLRESDRRLKKVDRVLENGKDYRLKPGAIYRVNEPTQLLNLDQVTSPIQAICAIGNPDRFFKTLVDLGLNVIPHPYPDHHAFSKAEIDLPGLVMMTEKDAVKCRAFCDERHYCLSVEVDFIGDSPDLLLDQCVHSFRKRR